MLEEGEVTADVRSVLESALRRVGELEFLVEGLELVGATPGPEGVADVRQAVDAAAERAGMVPDRIDVAGRLWDGVPHRYVERVAFELLSNAARHGAAPVFVDARYENGWASLLVADHGAWEPPSQQFSAFFQQDMSATRRTGGFGLGLFVASRLCQSCGGDLTIRAIDGRTIAEARFRPRSV
jgi:two-component system osmolarity sensor histidine kinase EnvZ